MKKIYAILIGCFLSCIALAQPAGWTHVQPFSVQNNMATALTNYQLRLTVNTQVLISAGQMLANGNDLRFGKDCNGTTLLNYWIESGLNTTNTVIWVKMDVLPASAAASLFMYYGNSSAGAASSIPGVFIGPHSGTDSTANTNLSGSSDAQRGFRFAPTEDILITAFGKNEPSSNPHYVTLFDYNTQALLSQQQVAGPSAQWSYTNIANPMWLTQNTQYLLEIFFPQTDQAYYFGAAPTVGQHITYFDMRYCNSCTQNTFPTNVVGGMLYGYVDMWYWTKQNAANPPTVTGMGALTMNVTSASPSVCTGDSTNATVTISGGPSPYSIAWSPTAGVSNPASATPRISPAITTTYTVTVTDGCGATHTALTTINVNPAPAVAAGVSTDSVCTGSSFTPMGSGADSYSWSGGLTDNSPFTPSMTNTYTVTGTALNGCTGTAAVTVEVLPLPAVVANITATTVCTGDTVLFTGSGAMTYAWDNGVTDNMPYLPSSTMMYHVTGTDAYGCVNWDSVTVAVNQSPNVTASSSGSPYCEGMGSAVLTGNGADSYFWMPGAIYATVIGTGPSVTTTYTVTGTDSITGCSAMATVTVTVNPNPVLATMSDSTCSNACAQLNAMATNGSGPYAYQWMPNTGLNNASIANPLACNASTTCYTVMVTDANGCTDQQPACAYVAPAPVVAISGPANVCVTDGSSALTGTPAGGSFSGPGVSGNMFSPAAAGNGTHSVIYTYTDAGNGCSASDTLTIMVSACVGITGNNAQNGIEVFPNPFGAQFTVNLTETGYVRMFNNLGQTVFEQEMNAGRNDVNAEQLARGIYTLEVTTASGTTTLKVVKQ